MRNLKEIGWIIFMLAIMTWSCSDEQEPFVAHKVFSGENSKTWKLVRLIARNVDGIEYDQLQFYDACDRDDRYIFYANKEMLFEVSNGTFSCGDEGPLLVSYTWSFNNANASLSMVFPHIFGYYFIPFTVKNVTEDEMELEIFVNEEGTESYALILESIDED